ncbi:MAG TPA: hypothetical protein VFJ84_02400 [Candidatus Saccharimonadales bacterium]|nr:hypothetical protein [Candidatus Saccharimonadales bacterium]
MDQKLIEQSRRFTHDRRPPVIIQLIRAELQSASGGQERERDEPSGASRQ